MTLTKEEQEKLHENLKMILDYIQKEIQPKLHGAHIQADFGPMESYPTPPNFENRYHLSVYKDDIVGREGGLTLELSRVVQPDDSVIMDQNKASFFNQQSAGLALVQNWQVVKAKLHAEIEKLNATREALNNFKI